VTSRQGPYLVPTAEESWRQAFPSSVVPQEIVPRSHPDFKAGVTRRIWFGGGAGEESEPIIHMPVMDVGMKGEFRGDICLPLWRDWETPGGQKKHAQMWALQNLQCQYVGFRWSKDGHFECFPWRPLQEWWLQVMKHRGGKTWRREFATNTNTQGVFSVVVPAQIARNGVHEQIAAASFPWTRTAENVKTGVGSLTVTRTHTLTRVDLGDGSPGEDY
jgi:hypothetical protein